MRCVQQRGRCHLPFDLERVDPQRAAAAALRDGDERVDLSDAVATLLFLFDRGPAHVLASPGDERTRCVPIAGCR